MQGAHLTWKASRGQPCVPPVSVHPLMLSSVRPRKAERLLLKALNAGGACLAWGRPGPHPRALTRSRSEPHGPRQPAKSCRELRFVSSQLPPLEYLLLQTLRSDLAAAMQLGAGDGQLATLGGPGPSVKWCGSAPASGAQVTKACTINYDVVCIFHTCDWNRKVYRRVAKLANRSLNDLGRFEFHS